jgi:DNA-directed RNA polymerase sigma subunit (sigma70/sigma32)
MARKASTYIGDDSKVDWGRVYTHEEIAEHMGLTKMRVCQIEKEALAKIRAMPGAEQILRDFLYNDKGIR